MTTAPELRRALAAAQSYALSDSSLALLALLHERGETTMGLAAKILSTSSAALTGLADKLEKLGFATRVFLKTDRRKICIEITPLGVLAMEGILSGFLKPAASAPVPTLGLRLTR